MAEPQRIAMQSHSPPDRAYSVTETLAPAGMCVAPHVVSREDLHVHVLKGHILVALDGHTHELKQGEDLRLPRNVPRAIRVLEPSRLLWFAHPAGIEQLAFLLNDPHVDPDDVSAMAAAAGVSKLPRSLWNGAGPSTPDRHPAAPPPAASGP
jgi:hypothetical protein